MDTKKVLRQGEEVKKEKKPLCHICKKQVDHFLHHAVIGPFHWWGVRCHDKWGQFMLGVLNLPKNYMRSLGKAFDPENEKFQLRHPPEPFNYSNTERLSYQEFLRSLYHFFENNASDPPDPKEVYVRGRIREFFNKLDWVSEGVAQLIAKYDPKQGDIVKELMDTVNLDLLKKDEEPE